MEEIIRKTVYRCYDFVEAKTVESLLQERHIPAVVVTPEGAGRGSDNDGLIEVRVPAHYAVAAGPVVEKFELAKEKLIREATDNPAPPESKGRGNRDGLTYAIMGIVMPVLIAGFFLFLGISLIRNIFIDKNSKDIAGALITGILFTILPAAVIYAMIRESKKTRNN